MIDMELICQSMISSIHCLSHSMLLLFLHRLSQIFFSLSLPLSDILSYLLSSFHNSEIPTVQMVILFRGGELLSFEISPMPHAAVVNRGIRTRVLKEGDEPKLAL